MQLEKSISQLPPHYQQLPHGNLAISLHSNTHPLAKPLSLLLSGHNHLIHENIKLTQSNKTLQQSNSQLCDKISNIFDPFASTAPEIQETDSPANDISLTDPSLTITIDINHLLTQ